MALGSNSGEVAKQVFSKDNELNRRAESSTAKYGGDPNIEIKVLSQEDIQSAATIYSEWYLKVGKPKGDTAPESLTEWEILAGDLAPKLYAGEQLTNQEQVLLYFNLADMKAGLEDPSGSLAKDLGLVDASGRQTEKYQATMMRVDGLREEIFFNTTGRSYPELPRKYDADAVKEIYLREETAKIDKAVMDGNLLPIQAYFEKKSIQWQAFTAEDETWGQMYEDRASERSRIFANEKDRKGPEAIGRFQEAQALEKAKQVVLKHVDQVYFNLSNRSVFRPQIEAATTRAELEAAIASTGIVDIRTTYELNVPHISRELAREKVYAQRSDALVAEALRRELPPQPAEINVHVNQLEVELQQELQREKAEKDPKKKATITERIKKLQAKIEAAKFVLQDMGKVEGMLQVEYDMQGLMNEVPGDYQNEFEDLLAEHYGFGTYDDAKAKGTEKQWQKDVAAKVKQEKSNFTLLQMLFSFLGGKVK